MIHVSNNMGFGFRVALHCLEQRYGISKVTNTTLRANNNYGISIEKCKGNEDIVEIGIQPRIQYNKQHSQ